MLSGNDQKSNVLKRKSKNNLYMKKRSLYQTVFIISVTLVLSGCTGLVPEDAQQGGLSPKGALGILGFTKDNEGNYIILVKQNNLYDNSEMRLSKCDGSGKFVTDNTLLGANSKDNGATANGNPGGAGSGRLAYNPDKNEIAVFTCYSGAGHQYSYYGIVSNDNATFGKSIKVHGGQTFSHCFDQRTVYHQPTKQFYQLSHGDAYPRTMGMYTANTDNNNSFFWRYIVRPPKANAGYGGNVTHSRIGDLAVFNDGNVAATVVTPFYDNDFINSFLPNAKKPCYEHRNDDDDINLKIWKAAIDQKYPKNVLLNIIPFKSQTFVKDGSIGVTPDAINLSGYQKSSNMAAGIPKVAIFGNKVLVAWLSYQNYNYDHAGDLDYTVFCIYDITTSTITKRDSVPGAKLFHTVSILADPNNAGKAKWITPNETELVYHELDVNTFEAAGFDAAYKTKPIALNINNAKTAKPTANKSSGQFGPLGWYGSNPEIDYVINSDGSMDILWLNTNDASKMYGKSFYPLFVTSIDAKGDFSKITNIPVRASK